MPETDIRTLVSLETDDKGVDAARQQLKQMVKDQQNLVDAFKRGEKGAVEFNKEMADLLNKEKGLEKAIDAVTGEFSEQAKAMREAAEEAAKLAQEQEQLSTAQGRFDKVSQDVALAGDFEGSLRTVGGAAGALGGAVGGKIEKGIGGVAEIGALIEALPKLKEAAMGLPGALQAAATAIGPAGFVAIALIGGITAIVLAAQKGAEEMKRAAEARLLAEEDMAQQIAGGLTIDAAEEQLAELQRLQEEQTKLVIRAEEERVASWERTLEATGADDLARTREFLGQTDSGELDAAIQRRKEAVAETEAAIEQLNVSLADGTLAANDAAQAERDLAAERTQGVLNEAQQAGELEATKLRLADATQEQIDAELQGLEIRKASVEAELASLQASGDTSEEVKAKIEQLTESLSFLGEQSTQLNTLRETAKTDKQVEAEKKLAAAREETAKAADKATTSEAKTRSGRERRGAQSATMGFGALFGFGKKTPETQKAQDEAAKQQEDFQDKLRDIQQQAQDERVKEAINAERKLADTIRNFGDQRQDDLEDQNFLALDKLNTQESRAKRDLSIENNRANQDINRQARQANERLMQEMARAQDQRLNIERQGYQQALTDANAFVGGLLNLFGRLPNARSGGSSAFRTQPRTP